MGQNLVSIFLGTVYTGIDAGLDSGTMTLRAGDREISVCGSFTKRQAAMLRAGGLLNYTKEGND